MLARYRKSGVKKFSFGNISVDIRSDTWTSISDVRLFMKLQEHPKVFDVVKFFDYRPLIPLARKIWVEKNLIKTLDNLTADKLGKMQFLKLQATKPEVGEYIFRIVNYDNRDFRVFDRVDNVLNVFMHRGKGGIGDVIMTTPVVEAVKARYPRSQVTYACPIQFLPLLEYNSYIDNLLPLKAEATQHDYDIVVDLTTDCIRYELSKGMDVDMNRPEIFVNSCGLLFDYTPAPKVFLSGKEILLAKTELSDYRGPKVGFILTSCAPVRRWYGFSRLREEVLGEYEDAVILEVSEEKPVGWKGGDKVHPVFNRSLREVAALLNECDVVIAPDTGPAHIASALRIPTIWLFTHINGEIRTRGYKDAVVIQGRDERCPSKGKPCWYEIPCSKQNNVSILELRQNPLCAQSISVEMVMDKVREVLDFPNISYIIVYYGQEPIVEECLRRVFEYRRWNDEVIIVNNGSAKIPHESFGFINDQHGVKVVNIDRNLGCIIGRNHGLREASGKYVVYVDSDQFLAPESVHCLAVTEGDLVGTEAWSMDNAGLCYPLNEGKGRLAYVGAGGMLAERSVLEELGGFNEDYAPAWFEDPDICFRAKQKGYSIGYHKGTGILHLAHRTVNNQVDFDWKVAWDRSHEIFMRRWRKYLSIRFIRLLVDVPGWAWDVKAQQLKRYLSTEWDMDVEYTTGDELNVWGDELYFTFECNPYIFKRVKGKRPFITGVTAHTYQNMVGFETLLAGAVAIHANSRLLYEEVNGFNRNCFYLPNGVDEDLFRYVHRDIERDEFTVGYVGKSIPRKGLNQYIVPACNKAGVKLVTQACKYKDSNRIHHMQMPGFYAGVDCILIASDMDGTPNQLLEAASVGRTFVGNRIGNVPEFVDEGVNGFMVEREVDAYVEKLLWLKEHREECRKMGIEARRTVEGGWTWAIQAEKYREMFRRCI